jgi:ABC-type microcin C transport system permease subunit YejE
MRIAVAPRLPGTRLLAVMLAGLLALAPMPLLAAVYKCERDNQVVYSDAPCGKNEQKIKPQVVVIPSSQPAAAPPAKEAWSTKKLLKWLGLDSRSGVIAALLFGIPLSLVLIFFLTRKSER